MAFPSVTNVDGTNPGPNSVTLPDTTQSPIGNVQETWSFAVKLSPSAVANATTAEQTFAVLGLITTDYVAVDKPTAQAGLGIVGTRVSAAGVLAITFANVTAATITPTASESYRLHVVRVQPNWTAPASGSQIDE